MSSIAAATGITIATMLLYKRKTNNRNNNIVLFFPADNTMNSYQTLPSTINSARISIDVCVYCISNYKLVDILINAHQRGRIVRVITDCEQETISGGQVWRLRQSGIQVRTNNSSYLMHHKFCIVDNVHLINGSLNWTAQGIECNEENVVITTEEHLLKEFLVQFNKLWNRYNPINIKT